jgi:hypothetical protein
MMAVAAMTQLATWDRNTDYQREIPEPGVELQAADAGAQPEHFPGLRQPFRGIRAVKSRLVHNIMPSTPNGPRPIAANSAGAEQLGVSGGQATMPIRAASTFVPIQSASQTTPWYSDGGIETY